MTVQQATYGRSVMFLRMIGSGKAIGNGEWRRGMRVGSARTGKVLYFIPDPADPNDGPLRGTSFSEGVAVDAAGNIYGAEVGPKGIKKYVRREQ